MEGNGELECFRRLGMEPGHGRDYRTRQYVATGRGQSTHFSGTRFMVTNVNNIEHTGALVLSRHRDETVEVDLSAFGGGVGTVTVVGIQGDKVRLAFNFNRQVPVNRLEVANAIRRERQGK